MQDGPIRRWFCPLGSIFDYPSEPEGGFRSGLCVHRERGQSFRRDIGKDSFVRNRPSHDYSLHALAGYRLPGTHTQDNAGTKTQAMVEIPTV